jgi:hypothetical protein
MPSTYNGWPIVVMPSTPWPQGVEFATNSIVAANTNPFTGQQQTQDWQATFMEGSISLPPMKQTAATAWVTFLKQCNGVASVFQFPAALAAQYPETLTSDGTNQRWWRLKTNQSKWSIKIASIYGISFEIREAI